MDRKKDLIGKKVYVILKSGRNYTGLIDEVDNELIYLTDKFNERVLINISEISSLEVEE